MLISIKIYIVVEYGLKHFIFIILYFIIRYIDSSKEVNEKDSMFRIGDIVRISKYKNAKVYTPNWPEEDFMIKKVKNTVPWRYIISDLNWEQIVGIFYEKKFA